MALRTKLLKYLRIVELMQLKTKTVRILKVKQHKVKSDSPEPVGMGDEPDTQMDSSGSAVGATEEEDMRAEVMTPEHSLIDLAENPLDRRAMASLKKQLEIESKSGQDLGAGHSRIMEQEEAIVATVRGSANRSLGQVDDEIRALELEIAPPAGSLPAHKEEPDFWLELPRSFSFTAARFCIKLIKVSSAIEEKNIRN